MWGDALLPPAARPPLPAPSPAVFGAIASSDAVLQVLDAMRRARDSAPAAAPPPVVLLPPPPPRAISGMEAAGLVLLAFAAGATLGARLR